MAIVRGRGDNQLWHHGRDADESDVVRRGVQFRSATAVQSVLFSNGDVLYVVSATLIGNISVVLPDATKSSGQRHTVKNNGVAGTVLITATVGNLDGTLTASANTAFFSMTFMSDGSNWWKIGGVT